MVGFIMKLIECLNELPDEMLLYLHGAATNQVKSVKQLKESLSKEIKEQDGYEIEEKKNFKGVITSRKIVGNGIIDKKYIYANEYKQR